MTSFRPSAHQQAERESQEQRRIAQAVEAFGSLTASARNADASVVVQCAPGGSLQSLHITPAALRRGAAALRADILQASKRATARANQRTEQAYTRVLGSQAIAATRAAGLTYDPELLEDPPSQWSR